MEIKKIIIILLALMLLVPNAYAYWTYYYDEKGKLVGSSETVENINYDTNDEHYYDLDVIGRKGLLP